MFTAFTNAAEGFVLSVVTQIKERTEDRKKGEHRGKNKDRHAVKSGSMGRQQMGEKDNTHRSQQKDPRVPSSPENTRGSNRGEGGGGLGWGAGRQKSNGTQL